MSKVAGTVLRDNESMIVYKFVRAVMRLRIIDSKWWFCQRGNEYWVEREPQEDE